MSRLSHILAAPFLLAVFAAVAHGEQGCSSLGNPCSGHLKTGPGTAICLQRSPGNDPTTKYVCAGSSVTLSVTTSDQDAYGDPVLCDAKQPILSWSDSAGGSAGNQTSYTFNRTSNPGTYTVTCIARDGDDNIGDSGYDTEQSISWTVAVSNLGGPIVALDGTDLTLLCPPEDSTSYRFLRSPGQPSHPSTPTYHWSISRGSDKVEIVGSNSGQQVNLRATVKSGAEHDVTLRLVYTWQECEVVESIRL